MKSLYDLRFLICASIASMLVRAGHALIGLAEEVCPSPRREYARRDPKRALIAERRRSGVSVKPWRGYFVRWDFDYVQDGNGDFSCIAKEPSDEKFAQAREKGFA